MRILQVTHCYLPESSGGTEVHVQLLAQALSARHEVAVCSHLQDHSQPEHALLRDEYAGLPVYRLVNNFTWGGDSDYFFHDPGQDPAFTTVLDEFRPDVVHMHHLGGGLSTSFPEIILRRGIPLVLTLHDYWPMCYRSHLLTADQRLCPGPDDGLRCTQCWQIDERRQPSALSRVPEVGLWQAVRLAPAAIAHRVGARLAPLPAGYHTTRLLVRNAYLRRLLNRCDRLLAPSQFLRNRYLDWGVQPDRLDYVQNGVHPANLACFDRALPDKERLHVDLLGSLLPHKGLDVLIEAANLLADAPIDLHIHGRTEGSASTVDYVRALRARLCNPHVTFDGPYAPAGLGAVLSQADVVVVPSILYENCPLVILEAQYAGRPVVTSDVGGMAELVQDGVNGLTFPVGDAPALADRLRRLAQDRRLLHALQRGIVPPRTMDDVASTVEALYAAALARRHGEG